MVEVGSEERLTFGFGPKLNISKITLEKVAVPCKGAPCPHSPTVSDGDTYENRR